jgi:hypothetical protein
MQPTMLAAVNNICSGPDQEDLGRLVILPGGEAGILTAWWHAPDHSEWRWQLELSNCRHARESAG